MLPAAPVTAILAIGHFQCIAVLSPVNLPPAGAEMARSASKSGHLVHD